MLETTLQTRCYRLEMLPATAAGVCVHITWHNLTVGCLIRLSHPHQVTGDLLRVHTHVGQRLLPPPLPRSLLRPEAPIHQTVVDFLMPPQVGNAVVDTVLHTHTLVITHALGMLYAARPGSTRWAPCKPVRV